MGDDFKKPRTPLKKKINLLESDIDYGEISIDDSSFCYDDYELLSTSQFVSQNVSQLSQILSHSGTFTYLNLSTPLVAKHSKNVLIPKHSSNSSLTFFNSILQINSMDKYFLLIEMVNQNYHYFISPRPENVAFLRYYFTFYSKLSAFINRASFCNYSCSYKKFLFYLFENIFAFSHWERKDILEIFYDPSKQLKHENLFNMISFILKCINKHERNNLKYSFKNVIDLALSLLRTFESFFYNDCALFFKNSDDYVQDLILFSENIPVFIKIIWNRCPNYLNSTFKSFIYLYGKSIECFINTESDDSFESVDLFCFSMTKLFILLVEFYRIGVGNARPSISILSNRNVVCAELYEQLVKNNCVNWKTINYLLDSFAGSHHLKCQFILHVLSKNFIDLNQEFAFAELKDLKKLSIRLIVYTFLLGDLEQLKKFQFGKLRKKRRSESFDLETSLASKEKRKRSKRLKKTETTENKNLSSKYSKYIDKKTVYGGNSLHIACRNGDHQMISELFQLVNPNLPDYNGFTPLMDAVRNNYPKCVKALIESAKKTGTNLCYETISHFEGFSALHYAVEFADNEIIRLLLENGGQHLLNIQSSEGKLPEDLADNETELKQLLNTINYKSTDSLNYLPSFQNEEVAFNLENYCKLVGQLIHSYLNVIKLNDFHIETLYGQFTDSDDMETLNQMLHNNIYYQFNQIFKCQPTSDDVEDLLDDLFILSQIDSFAKQFYQLVKKQYNPKKTPKGYKKILNLYIKEISSHKMMPVLHAVFPPDNVL